jgi:hypothetical protein
VTTADIVENFLRHVQNPHDQVIVNFSLFLDETAMKERPATSFARSLGVEAVVGHMSPIELVRIATIKEFF